MATATRIDPLSYLTDQLNELKMKGTHFKLRVLDDEQAPVCTFDGKRVINLASNNYLGLTTHPKLRESALEATRKYGVGSGAVRTIAGTMKIHMELEEKIARFKNVEACVVFQSGFAANAGTVSAVLGKEDFIISDQLNHASIIDGARLSRAKILVFEHKNVADAEAKLASVKDQPGKKLLISDGVFSMDGDIGPLAGLCDLAEKYGAIMMVDDAHASGVLGRNGRGTVDHFKVHGRVDIQVGTLSKAIGALGGYVCGSHDLIDFLYHRARPFLFSTSHPPSVAATCIAAFEVLEQEPERIEKLWTGTPEERALTVAWFSGFSGFTQADLVRGTNLAPDQATEVIGQVPDLIVEDVRQPLEEDEGQDVVLELGGIQRAADGTGGLP